MKYKPSYVWPNKAFPFRVYFESKALRVFIIENIQHNWEWLSEYAKDIKSTDFFFVYCGWYHSKYFAKEAEQIFSELGLNVNNFFFMFNEDSEKNNFSERGFVGDVINQNAWLDENHVMRIHNSSEKLYNAIYVGRFSPFKRHHLAKSVSNLALVAGVNHSTKLADNIPDYTYRNDEPLTPEEVCEKINQSKCGLILSAEEGACFASSEYLLCGIPVVSTPSHGGRSVWYNDYNSIVCDETPASVSEAVEYFVENPRDPQKIRNGHISLARHFRAKFISVFAKLLYDHGVFEVNAEKYFYDNFMHKLRKSYQPNFDRIFRDANR